MTLDVVTPLVVSTGPGARQATTGRRTASQRLSIPAICTLLVLVTTLFAVAPMRDAATMLDAITLLSARQHVAAIAGVITLWALWRVIRGRSEGIRMHSHLASLAIPLTSIVLVYAAVVYLPRPMAYLASTDPDMLRIDFHSHTNASSDANQAFTAERSRAWHQAGGYDVAYVTDHAAVSRPERGKAGVIFLPGIEANWLGEHMGVLAPDATIRALLSPDLHDVEPKGQPATVWRVSDRPLLIWNHPRTANLDRQVFVGALKREGVRAIEISNGAPHSMDLIRGKREQIVAFARRYNLALTSGTDNHGWGHAAPNWTLLRLPHWRDLDTDKLAARIEQSVSRRGFSATRVVERATIDPGTSKSALALTLVAVPWRMLTTLTVPERMMWIFWIWVSTFLVGYLKDAARSREIRVARAVVSTP
jgi:hypothetical protein